MMSTTKDCSGTCNLKVLFKQKCFFMVLIIITCAELLTLLALVLYWRGRREDLLTPAQRQLCLKQGKFITTKKMKGCPGGMIEKIENRTELCCGNAGVVFNSLVYKSVSEKYNDNANPVPVGTSAKIFWNAPVVSDVKPEFKYLANDGTIYLERSGFYYVTSQVKMMFGNMSSTIDAVEDTFRHYVNLISNKGVGYTLVGNAKSRCKTIQEDSEYTSIVGAVFKLQKGDRMYVAISHPHLLTKDQTRSYFSIYSILLPNSG